MASTTTISIEKLARLIGTPCRPMIIDVRTDEDFAADPRLIPGAVRRPHQSVGDWAATLRGQNAVIACQRGAKLSEGTAALLRLAGIAAETLEGGHLAWAAAGLPLVRTDNLPPLRAGAVTRWVTRARPKIDRIACPWLIRRFIDADAEFLFVAPSEVSGVADRFSAVPFDVEGVFWSHRAELCTFDVMIAEFGLGTEPLLRLATMVRAADTARLDLAPEAAGLLAVSLGLSRLHADDLEQLAAGMAVYDALYRWCRDATEETHNWPSPGSRA